MTPLDWINADLDRLRRDDLLRTPRCVRPLGDGWCEVDGRRLRNFASNDYLGLAGDPRVRDAAAAALAQCGAGSRASALVCGRTDWHQRLEDRLAAFEGTAAALLFPTGYAANVGTIAALVGRGDVVLCDRLNHASLVDGCRLSGARLRVYPHRDVEAVERELRKAAGARRQLIVTDSLFSMDGDAAPLRELWAAAERHGAMLLVDEAHATGVFGATGRGLTEELGLEGRPIVKVGTLSKAIGAQGGFVVGSRTLIDWLFTTARTQMFSTALAPPACAAACAALDLVEREPQRRRTLLRQAERLRERLSSAGLRLPADAIGPILPILLGDPDQAVAAGRALEERGHLVAAIRPPTVPRGTSRLRISLTLQNSPADVEALAGDLIDVLRPSLS